MINGIYRVLSRRYYVGDLLCINFWDANQISKYAWLCHPSNNIPVIPTEDNGQNTDSKNTETPKKHTDFVNRTLIQSVHTHCLWLRYNISKQNHQK